VEAGTLRELRVDSGVIRYREVGTGQVLIAWGDREPFFSPRLALRLQHDFPDARLEAVVGSRAFVPEDGPEQLANLVQKIFDKRVTPPRSGSPEEVFLGD
jgi:pimeloyl-ACP methyl ester carboxylesterase